MMKSFLFLAGIFLLSIPANAEIKKEAVEYYHNRDLLEGYYFYDDGKTGSRPAIIIVHQWKGISEHEFGVAEKLAGEGYLAFVADIYGIGIRPETNEEAGKQAGKYRTDVNLMRGRINAALDEVRSNPMMEKDNIAAIGYCFGGGVVLELARSGADIDGFVSFHGSLTSQRPEDAENIKGRVLILHGAADKGGSSNMDAVKKLTEEFENANVDYNIILYGGAVHSFTQRSAGNDPSKGSAYNEYADKQSWERMLEFFNDIFK